MNGGMPDEREQEERHGQGEERRPPVEPGVVAQVEAPLVQVHEGHHQERPEVHEEVGREVDEQPPRPVLGEGHDAHQQVAGVGDRGVGEQPLHVRLGEGGHVAHRHGQDGEHHQQLVPADRALEVPGARPGGREGPVEEAQHDREAGGLGQHREERGHGSGRALVDVGAPEVEGHRRDLEAEAHEEEQRDRVDREAVRLGDAAGQELLDPGQRGRPRHPVEEATGRRA